MLSLITKVWSALDVLKKCIVGLFIILICMGFLAPNYCGPQKLVPFGPNQSTERAEYLSPLSYDSYNNLHILGTDRFGRDVFVRIMYGTRTALFVGIGVVVLSFMLALAFGTIAGYIGNHQVRSNLIQLLTLVVGGVLVLFYWRYGYMLVAALIFGLTTILAVGAGLLNLRRFNIPMDVIIMKLIEVIKTVPALFIILSLFAIFSQATMFSLIMILGLITWPGKARLLRAEILKIKNEDFITTTQVLGLSRWRTVCHHLMPNVISPLIIASCYTFTGAIIVESTLSFLSVGLPQDIPSWGGIMRESRDYFRAWWLAVFPGLLLFLTILTLNIIVDTLNDT